MVIDSSALIAILLDEDDGRDIFRALRKSALPGDRFISAPTMLEAYIVTFARKHQQGVKDLQELCIKTAITIHAFDPYLVAIAQEANRKYGKASGHKAQLNFGDCFSYALAKHRKDYLLCKGDDFIHTDLKLVEY